MLAPDPHYLSSAYLVCHGVLSWPFSCFTEFMTAMAGHQLPGVGVALPNQLPSMTPANGARTLPGLSSNSRLFTGNYLR